MQKTKFGLSKEDERTVLLRRLFWADRDFFRVGHAAKIPWFDKHARKFRQDNYAYFGSEEKSEAISHIVNEPRNDIFVKSVNSVYKLEKRYQDIDIFIGRFYYFDLKTHVKIEDRRKELIEKVEGAISDTKGRARFFLKAVIELYKDGRWDRGFGGVTWEEMLAKMRELGGPYPSPRDVVILKSYKIYFKTGSRRYPTHTVPEEMMPTIDEVLMSSKG
ncbi:MAG: hypothetical protein GWN01_10245 [Nitrosopumilaceae archaeon]|nr:hypothetical protein [Nitrosopumilaceae archaeon]NIU01281.1 hypothetical protein [Nitrosopumilaceae archaeon]NIU87629.1 hypothetical protein [Nitrosopumilaceae archaeon]NIV66054.1 hypothetical protein [Nitrosopumilaceae archaeon]NIX61883.1 hypothetical protein [Nitrosopumilaceae archaeon]